MDVDVDVAVTSHMNLSTGFHTLIRHVPTYGNSSLYIRLPVKLSLLDSLANFKYTKALLMNYTSINWLNLNRVFPGLNDPSYRPVQRNSNVKRPVYTKDSGL